jgi:DNA-binding LacI/PurR family transcriptional regulator
MSITRNDVARLAGVSSATVSYVVNNGPRPVSEDTRQKVLEAIDKLGYQPSAVARSLKTKKTTTIGVIVSDILNPVLSAVAKGIEDAILPLGYNMILCNSDEDPERELTFLNMLLSKQVDGIILLPTCDNKKFLYTLINQHNFHIVLLDRQIEGLFADTLLFDNVSGAYQATRHLIELGHRRIGFINLPTNLTPGHQRALGYKSALDEASIPYDAALVVAGGFKAENSQNLAEKIFNLPNPPSAILVSSNRLLNGVLEYVKIHGLKIPEDVALVVFDDIPYYSYFTPSITAVGVDADEFGRKAASLLKEQMIDDGSHQAKVIITPVQLFKRESTIGVRVNSL